MKLSPKTRYSLLTIRYLSLPVSAVQAALVFAILIAFCPQSSASSKDDMFNQAQQAAQSGRLEDAANLFCQVAKQDPSYHNGEAQQNCNIYRDQANRENAKNEVRFNEGVRFFGEGRYDDAEQSFRNVRTGPHVAEAQDYLKNKIPAAKAQAAKAGEAQAMDAKFDQGVQAYNNNSFSSAQNLFQQVTGGSHQADAQSYLQKIQQYQGFMQQGKAAQDSKNYSGAVNFYQQAASIKGDGPGDPNAQISVLRTVMASQPTPVQQQPQPAQPQPTRPVVSAVVQPTKHLDVKKLLKEAEAAKRKGDYGTARGKYAAVLSEDPGNAEATAALASLPAPGANQQASSDADVLLAKGIGEFYSGAYEDAEVHIKDYIGINGAKTPLAYFYRGASLLTRYYLHGEQDHHLLTEAQDDFKHAKKDSAFHPPDKLVSPKIIKVFEQTS